MLSARVSFKSVHSYCPDLQIRKLTFQRLVVHARGAAYAEENIKKALESTGIHPLNPRMALGKLKPGAERADHEMSLAPITTPKPYLLISQPRPPELSTTSITMHCKW